MAAPDLREAASIEVLLHDKPWLFEYFQAVRLLDQMHRVQDGRVDDSPHPLLGTDSPPAEEAVRFEAALSAAFPGAAVQSLHVADPSNGPELDGKPARRSMAVSFMGLTGPSGVLPQHFTRTLIEQHRANNDRAMDFQDLFNHRMISLFYRAWEKHRFAVTYERCRRTGRSIARDVFTRCVLSLTGHGFSALQGRYSFEDEALAFFSGHLAHVPRNVCGLEQLLADVLGASVRIEQFVGQWYTLPAEEQSRLPVAGKARSGNGRIGPEFTLGERVFLVDQGFRAVIGPLTLRQYERLLPSGDGFHAVQQWLRGYGGPQFDFEIRLILRAAEVPACKLGMGGSRLAWTTFLSAAPFPQDTPGARIPAQN